MDQSFSFIPFFKRRLFSLSADDVTMTKHLRTRHVSQLVVEEKYSIPEKIELDLQSELDAHFDVSTDARTRQCPLAAVAVYD